MCVGDFPSFARVRVKIPLRSGDWTIWPDTLQNQKEWFIGHPLELRPMRWDFLHVACDGQRVEIQPHYTLSTWDTFWTDQEGCVEVQALGGLFPITLGRQPELIKGIRSVLEKLPELLTATHPDTAGKIEWIHQLLFGLECRICTLPVEERGPQVPRGSARASVRATLSRGVWRAKMGKPSPPSPPLVPPVAPR